MDNTDTYLKAMLSLIARQTYPPEKLSELVSGRGTKKIFQAYNMCDGSKSQADIAKEINIDAGQFSRTIKQWIDDGIIIKIGEGRNTRLVHVYPLPDSFIKKKVH